jgi:DNA repair protein RadA/Sms
MSLCTSCGGEFPDGIMQCPFCRTVNHTSVARQNETILLSEVKAEQRPRLVTGFWDPIFGEPPGIAFGSVNLIGSLPGTGKSTLALQICHALAQQGKESLYLYGEGAREDIAFTAKRMKLTALDKIRVCSDVNREEQWLERILKTYKPCLLVIDSLSMLIPNLEQQAKYTMIVKKHCLKANIPALLICHVTKQEDYAGLMKTQHAVDGLFGLLEHLKREHVIELRAMGKNRNGPTNRVILVKMTETGLEELPPDVPKKTKKRQTSLETR